MPNFELLIHEIIHILLTFSAGFFTYAIFLHRVKTHSRKIILFIFLGALLGGFLLDVDHVFEYILAYGLSFQPDLFLQGDMYPAIGKAYFIFHAWEYVPILAILIYFTKNPFAKYFLLAFMLGLASHLSYDAYSNNFYYFGYSMLYRLFYGFDYKYFTH